MGLKLKKYEIDILRAEHEAKKDGMRNLCKEMNDVRSKNKLRRTFVDIGLDILDKVAGRNFKLHIYNERKRRIKKINVVLAALAFVSVLVFIMLPLGRRFMPKGGPRVEKVDLNKLAVGGKSSVFALKALSEYVSKGKLSLDDLWAKGLPPQARHFGCMALYNFAGIATARVSKVWKYKTSPNLAYVECVGFGGKKAVFALHNNEAGDLSIVSINLM